LIGHEKFGQMGELDVSRKGQNSTRKPQ
jgi:hypothetical protein